MILLIITAFFASACGNSEPPCKSKEACLTDPNCECWCSQKCGYRKKKSTDNPVYVENDPNGKHCYCKQWDVDHYEDNCVNGNKTPQPAGAQ